MICPKGQGITSICFSHENSYGDQCTDEDGTDRNYMIKCCQVDLTKVIDTSDFGPFFDETSFNKNAKEYSVFGNANVTLVEQNSYGYDVLCPDGFVASALHICKDYDGNDVSPLPGPCSENGNRDYGLTVGSILFVSFMKY